MVCDKCGTEVTKKDKFCPKCGAEVVKVKNKKKDIPEVEEYKLKDKEIEKLSGSFVSRDEKYIASLGNGYIMNYLTKGSMSKGFSFITDKRVYFKGSCLSGTGKKLVKTDEERTVDVKNITGSGFIYQRYWGIILSLLVGILAICVSGTLLCQYASRRIRDIEDAFGYRTSKINTSMSDLEDILLDNYDTISISLTQQQSDFFDIGALSIDYPSDYELTILYDKYEDFLGRYSHTPYGHYSVSKDFYNKYKGTSFQESNIIVEEFVDELSEDINKSLEPFEKQEKRIFSIYVIPIATLLGTFLIVCICSLYNYLSKRKTLFRIEYAGGCIAFDVSFYAKAEIDDFQKQLRRAKDFAEETATVKTVTADSTSQTHVQNSVPDELRKYADLLKEGLISQEEYDAMKKKILGL